MRVLSEHRGVVTAPVAAVRDLVLAVPVGGEAPLVLGGGNRSVSVSGGPERFRAVVDGVAMTIEVDRQAGWVQVRGEWWYCGRFTVREHPEGALVTQQTFNLAKGLTGRLVPYTVGRGHRRAGGTALAWLVGEVAARLGASGRLLD